jgi:hypothetical protein
MPGGTRGGKPDYIAPAFVVRTTGPAAAEDPLDAMLLAGAKPKKRNHRHHHEEQTKKRCKTPVADQKASKWPFVHI